MNADLFYSVCSHMRDAVKGSRCWGRVYAVGGCNRDIVMGNEIRDIDFAVELPDGGVRLGYMLANRKLTLGRVKMFKRYGTAALHLKQFPDLDIEIVQTRSGSYPLDRIDKAKHYFGTLQQDALRRDLTINTLYYDVCARKMLDPTGMALDDIRDHRLRTPSDPDITLADDPLRVLRMVRFSLRYGWPIPPGIWEAMERQVSGLALLKPERVAVELDKIAAMPQAGEAAVLLRRLGL